jgi:hypothetical protein
VACHFGLKVLDAGGAEAPHPSDDLSLQYLDDLHHSSLPIRLSNINSSGWVKSRDSHFERKGKDAQDPLLWLPDTGLSVHLFRT